MKTIFFFLLLISFSFVLSSDELYERHSIQMKEQTLLDGTALETALRLVQSAGSPTYLDLFLTSPLTVGKFRERILGNLEKYVEVLYLSEEQAYALTQLPPDQATQFLQNFCKTIVVTR